jgi:hypothetical protein
MVREGSEPFDLDAVLGEQLVEFATFLCDEVEAGKAPGQPHKVGGAAGRGAGAVIEIKSGNRTDAKCRGTEETAPGR